MAISGQPPSGDLSAVDDRDDQPGDRVLSRRQMLAATGAAATAIAAGATPPVAASSAINFASTYAQNPGIIGSVIVDELEVGDGMQLLEWIDNDGEVADLRNDGVEIRSRPEDDEPFNPITIRADRIVSGAYTDFPRDVYEEVDDEEEPVSAIDPDHWDGDLTIEEEGDGVRFDGTGTATFDDFDIDSGESRRYLFMVLDVVDLPSSGLVTISVEDESGQTVDVVVDPDADEDDDDVVATATGTGIVYQEQLGDLDDDLDTITAIEIELDSAEIVLHGLDLERQSRLEFGTREYLDEDEEIDTETIYQPSGEYEIIDLDGIESDLLDDTIEDLEIEIEARAANLSASAVDYRIETAERYAIEYRVETVLNFELPTGFDLAWSDLELVDDVAHPGDRYLEVGIDTSAEDEADLEDIDEDELTLVDRTSTYSDASIDDEVELSSSIDAGETIVVFLDYLVTGGERDDLETDAAVGPAGRDDGGILGTAWGWVGVVVAGIAGYVALIRRRATEAV